MALSVVGAVFGEKWWLAFPDIKSACLAVELGKICNYGGKVWKV